MVNIDDELMTGSVSNVSSKDFNQGVINSPVRI